jgi:hypothetical protein
MKARYWSVAIVLVLVNYVIFSTLFNRLMETDFMSAHATRTPVPTFTPAPAQPLIIISTPTPVTPVPTSTSTPVVVDPNVAAAANSGDGDPVNSPASEPESVPQLIAPGAVNIRSGPGLNYKVIGALNPDRVVPIVGRNGNASWWQIKISDDSAGWVSNAVVSVRNTDGVPQAEAPPPPVAAAPPQPASSAPPPPEPQKPKYQFTPTGWYDDTNYGLTRFLGDIKDTAGNPVNGAFVQASCGTYSTISYPSGPVGWGGFGESGDWPAGFYDITIDSKPVPCVWTLTVVDTDDRKTVKARLSEAVPVEVTHDKSIITANWTKNW